MAVYIFIYSSGFGDREDVKQILSRIKGIMSWRYDLPNMFYLQSDLSAFEISESIRRIKPNNRFIVSQVTPSQSDGWLPSESWAFLKDYQVLKTTVEQ